MCPYAHDTALTKNNSVKYWNQSIILLFFSMGQAITRAQKQIYFPRKSYLSFISPIKSYSNEYYVFLFAFWRLFII